MSQEKQQQEIEFQQFGPQGGEQTEISTSIQEEELIEDLNLSQQTDYELEENCGNKHPVFQKSKKVISFLGGSKLVSCQYYYNQYQIDKLLIFIWRFLCGPLMINEAYDIFSIDMIHGCDRSKFTNETCIEEVIVATVPEQTQQLLIVSLIFYIVFYFSYKDIIHYVSGVYAFFYLYKIIFIEYYPNFSTISMEDFGPMQALLILVIMLVLVLIHIYINFQIKLFNQNKKIFLIFNFSLVIFYILIIPLMAHLSCIGWEEGLTGRLEEPLEGSSLCKVNRPYICYPNLINNWFRFNKNCDIPEEKLYDQKVKTLNAYHFLRDLSKGDQERKIQESNYMTLPLTSKFTIEEKSIEVTAQDNQIKQSKLFKTKEEAYATDSEIILDLNNQDLDIRVMRNQTLIDEKQKINQEKHGDPNGGGMAKNIIFLYIDTLGRAQAHRKLPKLMDFLSQFAHGNSEYADIYEFYRYHSIDKKTRDNAFKIHHNAQRRDYLDRTIQDLLEDVGEQYQPNLLADFNDAGYITAHSSNTCTSQCTFRRGFIDYRRFFRIDYADHEFLMYDPQYMDPENYFSFQTGINSIYRRCIYKKDTFSHNLKYGTEFLKTYQNEKKVLFLESTDSHEITSEAVQFQDDNLVEFFEELQNMGLFEEETIVYILSDHGQHIINPFLLKDENTRKQRSQGVYEIERMLPLFQMVVTKDIYKKGNNVRETLLKNQQRLFGPQQSRNTMVASVQGFDSPLLNDSQWTEIREDMACKDLGFSKDIDRNYFCFCQKE